MRKTKRPNSLAREMFCIFNRIGEKSTMTSPFAGKTVAILVANGFDENQMTEIQRALIKVKATFKTVGPENGVVNGWQGTGWGHYFPLNAQIGETLGSDFDMLVLPGGERAAAKLKSNLHTRRIINHFIDAGKPVTAIGAGVGLLTLANVIRNRTVAAPADAQTDLKNAGAIIGTDALEQDGNLLTSNGEDMAAWVAASLGLFDEEAADEQRAA
jgi:protease I